ncbi:MAG TPA: nickel pincer cofactor biosynthesis protein LarC [Allocoleopsis sp.]
MKRVAYLECPTGIAGDMCLGALVHAGVPLAYLIEQLGRLDIKNEYKLWVEPVHRQGQTATKMHVELLTAPSPTNDSEADIAADHAATFVHDPSNSSHFHPASPASPAASHADAHPHAHTHTHADAHTHAHTHAHPHASHPPGRHLPEIERLIKAADLPPRVTAWSLAIFRRLAEAEAAVHGVTPEAVHFHEVGATDAIVDIVGTCLGLDWLGIEQIYCSPLPTGGGTVWAAHGRLPVPVPAVLKLWEMRQVPIYSNGINRELVTPTGAAIATTLASQFGDPPPMTLQRVGLGAGSIDLALPNILRLWIGETTDHHFHHSRATSELSASELSATGLPVTELPASVIPSASPLETTPPDSFQPNSITTEETIAVLETQIDDLNPQAIGYLFDVLLAAGALDVFTQPIGMKKSRPGILLTVLCPIDRVATCETLIFQETSTLGIRHSLQKRSILNREIQTVQLPYGEVRIKVAHRNGAHAISNGQPEFEDCAKLARQAQLPWQEISRLALQQWYNQISIS